MGACEHFHLLAALAAYDRYWSPARDFPRRRGPLESEVLGGSLTDPRGRLWDRESDPPTYPQGAGLASRSNRFRGKIMSFKISFHA